jgi:hypothetical protein
MSPPQIHFDVESDQYRANTAFDDVEELLATFNRKVSEIEERETEREQRAELLRRMAEAELLNEKSKRQREHAALVERIDRIAAKFKEDHKSRRRK